MENWINEFKFHNKNIGDLKSQHHEKLQLGREKKLGSRSCLRYFSYISWESTVRVHRTRKKTLKKHQNANVRINCRAEFSKEQSKMLEIFRI